MAKKKKKVKALQLIYIAMLALSGAAIYVLYFQEPRAVTPVKPAVEKTTDVKATAPATAVKAAKPVIDKGGLTEQELAREHYKVMEFVRVNLKDLNPKKPAPGTRWYPVSFQIIAPDTVKVYYEDGHTANVAVFKYQVINERVVVTILKGKQKMEPKINSEGVYNYSVHSYKVTSVKTNKDEWAYEYKQVTEN